MKDTNSEVCIMISQLRKRRGVIQEWEGGKEGWGWLVGQDSDGEECLVRGSVVVEQGEVDWDNIVGQAVVYCCRRQKKKGNVATKVWVGREEEQAEHVNMPEHVNVPEMEKAVESRMAGREQVVQGRVTHWVPEQEAGVIQTEEGDVIVTR